jgi:predicted amidohydrolase
MPDLKLTLVQTELDWEDIDANLARFTQCITNIREETHLIILPEMFSTGFSMNAAEMAESMDGNGKQYSGDSAVYSPAGEKILSLHNRAGAHTVSLNHADLQTYRAEFPAYKDADPFSIKP